MSCNPRCQMCYFSDANFTKENTGRFSPAEIERIAEVFFPWAAQLYLGCGTEPTTYIDFVNILPIRSSINEPASLQSVTPLPVLESAAFPWEKSGDLNSRDRHCKVAILCFLSKYFGMPVETRRFDPKDPSSASYLSTFSPGRRLEIKPPSPRGEGGGHAPPGEGSLPPAHNHLVAAPPHCAPLTSPDAGERPRWCTLPSSGGKTVSGRGLAVVQHSCPPLRK